MSYAIDLTPLIRDHSISVKEYVLASIELFRHDVAERLDRFS